MLVSDSFVAVKKASSEAFFCERGHEVAEHNGPVSCQANRDRVKDSIFILFSAIVEAYCRDLCHGQDQ